MQWTGAFTRSMFNEMFPDFVQLPQRRFIVLTESFGVLANFSDLQQLKRIVIRLANSLRA
jgi:hypothetical protein